MLQGGNSPRWAAGEGQSRILLALHTAELHNFYDPGILGAQKGCICSAAKA